MFDNMQAEYVSLTQQFVSASSWSDRISAAQKLMDFTHQVIDICHVECVEMSLLTLEHMDDLSDPQKHVLSKEIEKLRARTIRAEEINKSFGWDPILVWQADMEVAPREQLPDANESNGVVVEFPMTRERQLRLGQG